MGEILAARHTIAPYLYYENVAKAIDWLTAAFGLVERFRLATPSGFVAHAELVLGNGSILLGNVGPRNAVRPGSVRSSVYVFVADADEHCRRAEAAGAQIVQRPEDQPFGDRIYLVKDLEGHEWYFAQHLRDVSVAEVTEALRTRR